jgi:hypothetical protein
MYVQRQQLRSASELMSNLSCSTVMLTSWPYVMDIQQREGISEVLSAYVFLRHHLVQQQAC